MASIRIHPPLLWTAGIIWPPVCSAVVTARFLARRAQRSSRAVDDWLTIPALILNFGMSSAIIAGVAQHALGYSTPILSPDSNPLTATSFQETVVRKIFLAMTLCSTLSLMFTKLSCLLFYRRVFNLKSTRFMNAIIYVTSALIGMWGLGFFLGFIFSCARNVSFLWGSVDQATLCPANPRQLNLGLVISNFLLDLGLLIFPIPLGLKQFMSGKNKIHMLGIFALATATIAASATRLAIVVEELNAEFAITNHLDEDFVSTAAIYFEYLESYFALTVVCLPTLFGIMRLESFQTNG